jgi:hypothetical protein
VQFPVARSLSPTRGNHWKQKISGVDRNGKKIGYEYGENMGKIWGIYGEM